MSDFRYLWSLTRRLSRSFFSTAPTQILIAAVLAVALGFIDGIVAVLLLPLLAAAGVDVLQGSLGDLAAYVRRGFSVLRLEPTLGVALLVYVAATALQSLLTRLRTLASARAEHAFIVKLRNRLYASIAGANWLYVSKTRASELAHVLTDELTRVGYATVEVQNTLTGVFVALVYISLAARISWPMTATVVGAGAVLFGLLGPQILKSRNQGKHISEITSRLYTAVVEHVAGLRTAKSYGAEQRFVDSMAAVSEELAETQITSAKAYAASQLWFDVGSVSALAILVYAGLTRLGLSPAAVLILVYLFARVMPRVAQLQRGIQFIAHMLPSFEAVDALQARLDAEQERDAPASVSIPLQENVRLEHVSFSYGSADAPAISDISLEIPHGTLTAIVGPSGAGKSTIADLVIGLQRPSSGHISVDGRRLDDLLLPSWKREIGYVAQDTFLFHDTVKANLLWVNPTATDDQIADALQTAGAEFVFRLENGLQTVLGDRGTRLSGGERQRLALGRALLRNPRLLVLDEATSALDLENERHVLDAIDHLRGKVTTLLITHRRSAAQRADRIYVLDEGRLVDSGSWDALSSRGLLQVG